MRETVRCALRCMIYCAGIFAAAQLLRASGALSFLPENELGKAAEVFGNNAVQGWSDELVAVFNTQIQGFQTAR